MVRNIINCDENFVFSLGFCQRRALEAGRSTHKFFFYFHRGTIVAFLGMSVSLFRRSRQKKDSDS